MSSATQNCEFCQSPAHVWFNCLKKPDGWKPDRLKETAARKDVRREGDLGGNTRSEAMVQPDGNARPQGRNISENSRLAGTQAPPVDTKRQQVTPRFKSGKPSPKNSEPTPVTPADPPRSAAASRKAAGRASARKPSGEGDAPRRKAEAAQPPKPSDASAPILDQLQALADGATARIAAKPVGGRPKIHEDRKVYKAQKERERRARKREVVVP